jgi:flagellin-like hook-associated protein FlgL
MMQVEVSQLIDEVDRIASQAEFNTMKLLQGDFARTFCNGFYVVSHWRQHAPA